MNSKYEYLILPVPRQVWRFFGDLYHRGNLVCDRVYCSPYFENQRMGEGLNYYLGTLMPRIKHYAKSVSTGNLAIHLHDKHNIAAGGPSFSSSSSGRPGRSHSRSKHKFNLQRNSAINFFPFHSDS